jgi:hypothetical protein
MEEARREADARTDAQRRREGDERERRRRPADRRAARSDEALAVLRQRAEEALAAGGVARTRLGYEVLVTLKVGECLERESVPTDTGDGDESPRWAAGHAGDSSSDLMTRASVGPRPAPDRA